MAGKGSGKRFGDRQYSAYNEIIDSIESRLMVIAPYLKIQPVIRIDLVFITLYNPFTLISNQFNLTQTV